MPGLRLLAIVLACGLVVAACSPDSDPPEGAASDTATDADDRSDAIGIDDDGVDPLPPLDDAVALPIVFVHGFAGSAQQYESQAMRFAANGYPQERIVAYEHDGAGVDIPGYTAGLGEVIDDTLAEFGTEQVYLVGHSRGTGVSTAYLREPANATKVAKYVAIDGAPCPDVVPCLAPTQENIPGQAHVEVATSRESFVMQYEFLVGQPPEVVDIVPQRQPVELTGRAVNFPQNTGREGATLDIWEVDSATGQRVESEPHASFDLGADGEFGPVVVKSGVHYEYVLTAANSAVQHHLYLQPYVRSSHLVRLLSSPPDGPTRVNTNTADEHASIIAIRMREWYAADDPDLDGDQRDVLHITRFLWEAPTADQGDPAPGNVIVDFVGNAAIGLHIHDDAASPRQTTLAALPYFADQPFQSGIDVFMPAADPVNGTISVTNIPRGDASRPQRINVANWPSSGHATSVVFTDYPVD
jgi:pimeloyl-ACP methyl ester carboxylesterase